MHAKSHARAKAAQIEGWLISFLLHGAIVLFGLLLVKRTHLLPQPEPFRWNISIVSPVESDSPTAALPEKALPTELLTEPPPVVTSAPPTAFLPSADQPTQATHLVEASRLHEANSLSTTAEKVYQVVGHDGSISFTNVPPDSRYHEKRLDQSRLSTVESSTAPNANMRGVSPRASPSVIKDDYQWLWAAVLRRMVEETNGEVCYRVDPVEGKVIMKIVIDEVGRISDIQVMQSSGYTILDQSTVNILRQISPVPLPRPLGKPSVTLQFPMTYRLRPQSQSPIHCSRVNG